GAALDTVAQVDGAEQGGSRDDDGPQLHGGQDGLPELDLIAEHEDDAVAAPHALGAKPGGHAIGALGHLGPGAGGLAAILFEDALRRLNEAGMSRRKTITGGLTVKYLFLLYDNESAMPAFGSEESQQQQQAYGAFYEDVANRGLFQSGDPVQGSATAKTVRVR